MLELAQIGFPDSNATGLRVMTEFDIVSRDGGAYRKVDHGSHGVVGVLAGSSAG